MPNQITPTIIVIFGISGDLSRRKLLPAISRLAQAGVLPQQLRIVGVTRRDHVDLASLWPAGSPSAHYLQQHTELFHMDLEDPADYIRLTQHLDSIEQAFHSPTQRLLYLSIPPQASQSVIAHLGASGIAKLPQTKLLLEKPFGVNLASARQLVDHIDQHFASAQVYRIDHYMAKEMAQNLIVFREGNRLFNQTWNKHFIQKIDIFATEQIGIEGRAVFYEQTGALRDFVQSHLLQLAALTLMDATPTDQTVLNTPARRLAALKHLHLPTNHPLSQIARRGQYQGYRDEVRNPHTTTETFVRLTLQSSDPNWTNVPITLTTGKALDRRATEIHITYRADAGYQSNELHLQLQPDEAIQFCIWTKSPSYDRAVEQHSLDFNYKDHSPKLPQPYERVILDAINSDHGLFATSAEVLETWRILEPVRQAWNASPADLSFYQPGTPTDQIP